MSNEWLTNEGDNFLNLFVNKTPILDVRAPVEFLENHFLHSINIPILDDQQRALVGTCYKQQGQDSAIQLGHQLVSGDDKENKILQWQEFFLKNPDGVLTCFRGGLRSKTAQNWLSEFKNLSCARVQGGTKSLRQFLLTYLNDFSQKLAQDYQNPKYSCYLISGATGAGKTKLLKEINKKKTTYVLDLENLAKHRGSAFGGWIDNPQPTQAVFENYLAQHLIQWQHSGMKLVLEDESKLVGRCVLPPLFFQWMRSLDVVLVDEKLETRIENTFNEYVFESIQQESDKSTNSIAKVYGVLKKSLAKIESRLGNQKFNEIHRDLESAEQTVSSLFQKSDQNETDRNFYQQSLSANISWIQKLLTYYYDPMYSYSLEKRNPRICFQGTAKDCLDLI